VWGVCGLALGAADSSARALGGRCIVQVRSGLSVAKDALCDGCPQSMYTHIDLITPSLWGLADDGVMKQTIH
jgi:hypothetical protein